MTYFRFPVRRLPTVLHDFASEMESIVDHVLNSGECKNGPCGEGECSDAKGAQYAPSLDVVESDTRYDLYLDLPGVKPDQVKVEMHEDRLQISGSRTPIEREPGTTAHRSERVSGTFQRFVRLPKQVDVDKIEAVFDLGVLHVALPKQAQATSRTIEVRTVS